MTDGVTTALKTVANKGNDLRWDEHDAVHEALRARADSSMFRLNVADTTYDQDSSTNALTCRVNVQSFTVAADKQNLIHSVRHNSGAGASLAGTSGHAANYRTYDFDTTIVRSTPNDNAYGLIGAIRPGLTWTALQAGTSATSVNISTLGALPVSKTFTTGAGLGYTAGQFALVWSTASDADFMYGTVTSYSGTTLVLGISRTGGSGAHTDWNIELADNGGSIKANYGRTTTYNRFTGVAVGLIGACDGNAQASNAWICELSYSGVSSGGLGIILQGDGINAWGTGILFDSSGKWSNAAIQWNQNAGGSGGGYFLRVFDPSSTAVFTVDDIGQLTSPHVIASATAIASSTTIPLTVNATSIAAATAVRGVDINCFGVSAGSGTTTLFINGDGVNAWTNGIVAVSTISYTQAFIQRNMPAAEASMFLRLYDSSSALMYQVNASGATTQAGDMTFTGTTRRITGDMDNATVANRLSWQTSTANGNTFVSVIPNGSAVISRLLLHDNAAPTNCSSFQISAIGTGGAQEMRVASVVQGSGTYRRMTFYNNAAERMAIEVNGDIILTKQATALATGATAGFPFLPQCAGTPTGAPTSYTNGVPIVVDVSNGKVYWYLGGAWKSVTPA